MSTITVSKQYSSIEFTNVSSNGVVLRWPCMILSGSAEVNLSRTLADPCYDCSQDSEQISNVQNECSFSTNNLCPNSRYEVTVNNENILLKDSFKTSQGDPKGFQVQLSVLKKNNNSIDLIWPDPVCPSLVSYKYRLHQMGLSNLDTNTTENTRQVRNLHPDTEYTFVLDTEIQHDGSWSFSSMSFTTRTTPTGGAVADRPTRTTPQWSGVTANSPPQNVSAVVKSANEIEVHWKPTESPENGKFLFLVYCKETPRPVTGSGQILAAKTNVTEYTFTGLYAYTKYDITIIATVIDKGKEVSRRDPTSPVQVTTPVGKPSRPRIASKTIIPYYNGSNEFGIDYPIIIDLHITWESPEYPGGPDPNYVIELYEISPLGKENMIRTVSKNRNDRQDGISLTIHNSSEFRPFYKYHIVAQTFDIGTKLQSVSEPVFAYIQNIYDVSTIKQDLTFLSSTSKTMTFFLPDGIVKNAFVGTSDYILIVGQDDALLAGMDFHCIPHLLHERRPGVTCTLGLENATTCRNREFCNWELKSNTPYGLKLLGNNGAGWSETKPLFFELSGGSRTPKSLSGLIALLALVMIHSSF